MDTPAAQARSAPPAADTPYAWAVARRRPEAVRPSDVPMVGFGSGEPGVASYTLYLPNAETSERWTFENGRPVASKVQGAMAELPHLAGLRNAALAQLQKVVSADPVTGLSGIIHAGPAFLEYAAAVILSRYNVTDEELGMLLAGNRWRGQMLTHMLGGDDLVESLATHAPEVSLLLASRAQGREPDPQPVSTPPNPPERGSVRMAWLGRLFNRRGVA